MDIWLVPYLLQYCLSWLRFWPSFLYQDRINSLFDLKRSWFCSCSTWNFSLSPRFHTISQALCPAQSGFLPVHQLGTLPKRLAERSFSYQGVDRWYWTQCFASRESSKKWEEPWPLIFPARPSKMLPLDECLHGQFCARIVLKTFRWPRERLVMPDIGQLLRLQGWKDGHDRWSHSQDFTDFDQCILRPKDSTWDSVSKYRKPAVSHWNMEWHLYVRSVVGAQSEQSNDGSSREALVGPEAYAHLTDISTSTSNRKISGLLIFFVVGANIGLLGWISCSEWISRFVH